MKIIIYYHDKINIDFSGIDNIEIDDIKLSKWDGIEQILKYLQNESGYKDIGIRYMNNTLIPSPVEFNQITDYNIKRKTLQIFKDINNDIEFVNNR